MSVAAAPLPHALPLFAANGAAAGNAGWNGGAVADGAGAAGTPGVNGAGAAAAGSPNGFAANAAATPNAEAGATGWGRRVRSNGRLKDEVIAQTDRNVAIATHLSLLSFIWLGPLALAAPVVLWLARKDKSIFANDHGKEATNFVISFVLLHILLPITIIGIAFLPVLWVVGVVNVVRGAVAASQNEYFRYPMTIRFL